MTMLNPERTYEPMSPPRGLAVHEAVESCTRQLEDLYAVREAHEARLNALREAASSLEAQVASLLEEHEDLRRAAAMRREEVELFQRRVGALARRLAQRAVTLDAEEADR
jgi:chromosome segregation ATPase